MDTQFLETLKIVIDSGSFAEAGRQLNLTPAAVAQRVRAVEVEIGTALVSRFGRTVQPTAAGAAITARIGSLLGQVRDLKALAAGELVIGELRLGAITNPGPRAVQFPGTTSQRQRPVTPDPDD